MRDHYHLTGKFRSAAHEACNLKYKIPKFFPVVFHNLSGYDSHLFFKTLGNSKGDISYIPNNEENYISFTKWVIVGKFVNEEGKDVYVKRELRFIDSLRFMASSLDKLSSNLKIDQFVNLKKYYSGNQHSLLLRKGVYPYDYVNCLTKLDETSFLPKETFYSKLTNEGITDKDYQHAHTVWKEFNIETMKDYHTLYNLSDVLLLADIYENFRSICMNHYGLDPVWYFSAPGLDWNATLKITKVQIELLSDLDLLLMIESGIRGGIATISHHRVKANNECMGTEFDHAEEYKFILYLDANNLYGWAMSKQLPTSGFKWMTDNELDDCKHRSCFLEVDLEYSEDLHDLHNDYPLASERIKIENVEKLIPNLNNKTKYVVHYENLKLYQSLD